RRSSRTSVPPASGCPSSRRATLRPSGESTRMATMGIISAMTRMTARRIMCRILRRARPRRHLGLETREQFGAIANRERRVREHAFLRDAAGEQRRARPRDLTDERLAGALHARDELFLDLLRLAERRIARGLDGALQGRVHGGSRPREPVVIGADVVAETLQRLGHSRREGLADQAGLQRARGTREVVEREPVLYQYFLDAVLDQHAAPPRHGGLPGDAQRGVQRLGL